MKPFLACLLLLAVPSLALAQPVPDARPAARPAGKSAVKPAAKAAAKPATKTGQKKGARDPKAAAAKVEAIKRAEEGTPMEEPDPSIKLTEAELALAEAVYVGDIPCELGANVKIRALRRPGFFLVQVKSTRFVMHPVESRTGALRLEDPERGALWLQLGNKSMLMSQKLGQRLADECQSPDQKTYAETLKKNPINLLEPAPPVVAAAAAAAATAPAAQAAAAAPAEDPPVDAGTQLNY